MPDRRQTLDARTPCELSPDVRPVPDRRIPGRRRTVLLSGRQRRDGCDGDRRVALRFDAPGIVQRRWLSAALDDGMQVQLLRMAEGKPHLPALQGHWTLHPGFSGRHPREPGGQAVLRRDTRQHPGVVANAPADGISMASAVARPGAISPARTLVQRNRRHKVVDA